MLPKLSWCVGTQARILYQDAFGRMKIALRFNELVRQGEIGPVIIGRDHHDTGGTDSPFRENRQYQGWQQYYGGYGHPVFCRQRCPRHMSLVALHNGGGVGIGKAINGGFGLVLDGSRRVDAIITSAIPWDVLGGVARRCWARNDNALATCIEYNHLRRGSDQITIPFIADAGVGSQSGRAGGVNS